jgi:hypothetical protein
MVVLRSSDSDRYSLDVFDTDKVRLTVGETQTYPDPYAAYDALINMTFSDHEGRQFQRQALAMLGKMN